MPDKNTPQQSWFPDAAETRREIIGLRTLLDLRPGLRIADVACGMGRHIIPLQQMGCETFGLDSSLMMLGLAVRRAREAKIQLKLVHGNNQHLPFTDNSFDVMLNLFNSFGYLDTPEQDQLVFNETARCLRPGGQFLLETRNKKFQILYAPYCQIVEVGGRELVLRCDYNRETAVLHSVWFDADDQSQRVHQADIRLYSPAELENMLQQAGLEITDCYSGYDGTPFDGFERLLMYKCRKP